MADEKAIDLGRLSRFNDNLKANGLPLNDWQASKKYKVNYPVLHENKIYRCLEAHTASSTFDETKWETVSNADSGLKAWVENTLYKTGDIVVYGNGIYKCITEHTSTSTFDTSNWTNLSVGYVKKTLYTSNAYSTESTTITTSESMLDKDFIIIKVAYSEDGTSVKMNKSYVLAPVVGEVHDFSYQESTTSYIAITGKILNNTTLQFNFTEAQNITKFKIISIDSLSIGDKAGTTFMGNNPPINAVRRTLFEGSVGNFTGLTTSVQINLLDDFTSYDIIGFYIYANRDGNKRYLYREITKEQLLMVQNSNELDTVSLCWGYSNTDDYCDICNNSTSRQLICHIKKQIITKVVGIKYINENQYSTEEQLVGTWIDGKPLYQKTLVKTGVVNTNTTYFNDELPNVDYIQKISASFNTNIARYESEYTNINDDKLQLIVNATDNVGGVFTLFKNITVSEMYVTVQYTKTTD